MFISRTAPVDVAMAYEDSLFAKHYLCPTCFTEGTGSLQLTPFHTNSQLCHHSCILLQEHGQVASPWCSAICARSLHALYRVLLIHCQDTIQTSLEKSLQNPTVFIAEQAAQVSVKQLQHSSVTELTFHHQQSGSLVNHTVGSGEDSQYDVRSKHPIAQVIIQRFLLVLKAQCTLFRKSIRPEYEPLLYPLQDGLLYQ